jgi:polyisoprenoid-binding protein YceI
MKPGDRDRGGGSRARAASVSLLALLAWAASVLPAFASEWRIEGGTLQVTVPVKPGGSFEARSSALKGTLTLGPGKPAPLAGELSVDLATIDTGIGLRNEHLRDNSLEVAKGRGFDRAILSEIRLQDAEGEAFAGRTGFTGMLMLHGVRKPITGTAQLKRDGQGVRVEANYVLTLTDFDIKPPEYLGVGVANRVIVKVAFLASPASAAAR